MPRDPRLITEPKGHAYAVRLLAVPPSPNGSQNVADAARPRCHPPSPLRRDRGSAHPRPNDNPTRDSVMSKSSRARLC